MQSLIPRHHHREKAIHTWVQSLEHAQCRRQYHVTLLLYQCRLQFSHGDYRICAKCILAEWPAIVSTRSLSWDFVPVMQTAQDDVSCGSKHVQWRTDVRIILVRVVDVHLEEQVGTGYMWTCVVLLQKHISLLVHEGQQYGLNDGYNVPYNAQCARPLRRGSSRMWQ